MVGLKGAERVRFWIPFLLITGLYGFPGMDLLKNIINDLSEFDLELELKKELMAWAGDDPQKKAIAKTIFYGVFSLETLGGIDISRRIGGGDFIPSDIDDAFGPFFSSRVRAAQMASRGEWLQVLRAISTAPGNIAIALTNDGEITSPWDRNRLVTRTDTKGRILKGLGFRLTEESVQTDAKRITQRAQREDRRVTAEIIDDVIAADGDQEKLQEISDRVEREGINLTRQQVLTEAMKKKLTRGQRALLGASDKTKATLAPIFEFAGVE